MKYESYQEFLRSKIVAAPETGLNINPEDIHPSLFPHQRDIAIWALRGGKRAIFAQFGTGKTLIQLEIARQVHARKGGRFLICAPLSVIQEFQHDATEILGIGAPVYVRTREEVLAHSDGILITNYERVRDGDIDPNDFTGVSLDEASVLRGYGTKTYQTFLPKFANVEFRFVATATPAPNRFKELIHYAGFLGAMDTGEALTRFFGRNSQKANDLNLYPHKEEEFWFWVSSWAVFLFKPSDLGYSDEGYDLPELKVIEHRLPVDHGEAGSDSWGNVKMFRDAALGLSDAAKEKRDSLPDRVAKAREIVESGSEGEHWLIWHDLEAERKGLEKEFSEERESGQFKSVFGSQDVETREPLIRGFGDGEYRILATKPVIAGSGCNFQRHCNKAIFIGIGFKFNDFIQALHRIHRFLQTKQVEIHLIYTESEDNIYNTLMEKWAKHEELVERMRAIVKKFGLSDIHKIGKLSRTIGCDRQVKKGQLYTAVHNDCILEMANMEENSMDMICTSIPFGTQYEYCPSYNDFGHNSDNERFFEQMDFLIPELLRVLKPGRIAAIHVKDRIRFGGVMGTGSPTVDRFSDKTADAFERHGFFFMSRITITTDVVRENNQTYRLGWTKNGEDSTSIGRGMPEYVLLFRKPQSDLTRGYADDRVLKFNHGIEYKCPSCGYVNGQEKMFMKNLAKEAIADGARRCPNCETEVELLTRNVPAYTRGQWQIDAHGYWRSSGNRLLTPQEWAEIDMDRVGDVWKDFALNTVYDYDYHINCGKALENKGRLPASFMLFDPPSTNPEVWTDINRMNTLNSQQIRKKQEAHVCPLQIDIIERLVNNFTNEGETVLDPFGGLMTVPYVAVKLNRRGYGIELNEEYWQYGCRYMYEIEYKKTVPTLFDAFEVDGKVA